MPALAKVCHMAALLLALTAGPAFAIGPSFDCTKVLTPLAQFICASPDLSQTDLEFVQAYYALRQQTGPAGWQALKLEAVDFQNRVGQRCGISAAGVLPMDTAMFGACLQRGYAEQRSVWLSKQCLGSSRLAQRPERMGRGTGALS